MPEHSNGQLLTIATSERVLEAMNHFEESLAQLVESVTQLRREMNQRFDALGGE